MKALVRHNLYANHANLKITFFMLALFGISVFALKNISQLMLYGYIVLVPVLCPMMTGTMQQNNGASSWTKMELIFPIQRREIVFSKYITYSLTILLGLAFCGAVFLFGILYVPNIYISDAAGFLAFSTTCCLLSGAIYFPSVFKFGEEKSASILMISFVLASVMLGGILVLIPRLIPTASLLGASLWGLAFSIILFVISINMSVSIYQKKDF